MLFIFCNLAAGLKGQNAPVTSIGIITNANTVPGSTIVPVTVKNFISIGAFTLTFYYPSNQLTYVSANLHPSFTGMTITDTVYSVLLNLRKLIIRWPQTPGGITLPDETHLLDLNFTYISGNAKLNWIYTNGNICQYKKYSNGTYTILNDSPKQSYYINGGVSNRGAPVTSVPVIQNPSPGNLAIPVTVDDFTAIGALSLTLEYDPDVLTYQSYVPNPALLGNFAIGTQTGPNGKLRLVLSWFGLASLPDGSTLVTLNFIYSNTNGSCTGLDWINSGSACEYADQYANPFFDTPTETYYQSGYIYTLFAPKTWLPVIKNAVPSQAVALPVLVNDFINVRSFSLAFEYEPTVMIYSGFTPDAAFGSGLIVADILSGSKRKVLLSWAGTADKTLPAGSRIADIHFNYTSGTSTLAWIVTDETSCRFNDAAGNAYYDMPESAHYKNGLIASQVAPLTAGGQQSAVSGQSVVVPVRSYNFNNIGAFSLTLDYDPSVLTYQGAALVPAIGGIFSAATAGLGRIMMDWSGPAATLAQNSTLINLTFTYHGGATTLAWFDNGDSCRYTGSISGNAIYDLSDLYDLPQPDFYINGYVGPDPLAANFTANITSGDVNTTVTLTDLTTGSPTTWRWSLSPSSYYFVNGTSASSQHPQVKFTSNGAYTVTLIVTKGTAGAVEVKTEYLHIGTPGLWTGITSSDWNTGSNWHNYAVPFNSVNVVIPSAAPNWPIIYGNLNIGGAQCLGITLQDAAQLTVSGDLTINNGSNLSFTGTGFLTLGGDWNNSGIFNCGSSTVDFTGTEHTTLISTASPETFYKVILSKSGASLSIQGSINVIGLE